ncbi:MAG: hypothetical protein Q9M94_00020 [Candidatus Gracilibacteria bacterium]|nr:hypothetical protein [Candidatus Gracilibacteria bacterium]MDQ7023201.1 hypothetical protein [Candidatus Gracilibacteria bacterium]
MKKDKYKTFKIDPESLERTTKAFEDLFRVKINRGDIKLQNVIGRIT